MAEQLALVKTYDFESDQGTVSLLSNTDGFDVAYQGWAPNVTPARGEFVNQAITLRVQGTSTDHIATNLQKLADKAEECRLYYANGARDYAVWFRVQFYGETKGRQTLVKEIQHEPASSVYDVALRNAYHWNKYTLGISHHPWWEGTANGSITASSVNAIGGTATVATVIKGDLPARMAQVKITSNTGTIFPYGRAWLGVKSSLYSPAGSAITYWSFASPADTAYRFRAAGTEAIFGTADSTAQAGSAMVIPYGLTSDAIYADFIGLGVGAVTTTPSRLYGKYLVLLRAKLPGTASEWMVRLQTGWMNDYSQAGAVLKLPRTKVYPRVYVNSLSTSNIWKMYELGEVQIPENTTFKSQLDHKKYTLFLNAQSISGSVNLWVDGFVLIPTDGGFCKVSTDNPASGTAFNSSGTAWVLNANSPDGRSEAISYTVVGGATAIYSSNDPVVQGGLYPGTVCIYAACESNEQSLKTQSMQVEIKFYERWKEIRGND